MQITEPAEGFPAIGTVENPAVFYDGSDVLIAYQIAPVAGGGVAVLRFKSIFDFKINPVGVDGLATSEVPMKAWDFLEISGTQRTTRWKSLGARFWTICFNDESMEIVFNSVLLEMETRTHRSPSTCLAGFLQAAH